MPKLKNVQELAVPNGDLHTEEGHDVHRGAWVRTANGAGTGGRKVYTEQRQKVYGPRQQPVAPPANVVSEAAS